MKKVKDIKPRMKRLLKNEYDFLISKRAQQKEASLKRDRFEKDMKEAKKARGFGPWELLWEYKQESFKKESPYSHFPSYRIRQMILKGGDDLRQEMVAMQIINKVKDIFAREGTSLYLYSYEIIAFDSSSGALGNLQ